MSNVAIANALEESVRLQASAREVGFGWPHLDDLMLKLNEEAGEVSHAVLSNVSDAIEDEIGDLLFVAATIAHFCSVDPERALARANAKFSARFEVMEQLAAEAGQRFKDLALAQKEALWQRAKLILG